MHIHKNLIVLLGATLVSLVPVLGTSAESSFANVQKNAHHLDIEISSRELRALLQNRKDLKFLDPDVKDGLMPVGDAVAQALRVGERLLSWVDLINSKRTEGKIRLTSPSTRRSYPITAPNRYSPRTIEANLRAAREQMPAAMRDILFSESPLSDVVPVSDEEFIVAGRALDRVYQSAARWTMLSPYKREYSMQQLRDIRGYYFLKTNKWDAKALRNWATMDLATQAQVKEALAGICMNSFGESPAGCKNSADAINSADAAIDMYNRYFITAESTYESFFEIQNARRDIAWNSETATVATIPFLDPVRPEVRRFVKDNIEAEYSWLGWGLKINFGNRRPAPYIVFVPGTTANVEYIGGNKISMDANKSMEEYEEQWTIRHEFGHVLGFPDCYHEFYDNAQDEFVNYQLDVTDLMCSRAGNMNQRIYDQLKSTYMR